MLGRALWVGLAHTASAAALSPFPSLRLPAAELQQMLRTDIGRRSSELFALGWLGHAYLAAPRLFDAVLPAVWRLEVYTQEEGALSCERDHHGRVQITLRERSVVSRGESRNPFPPFVTPHSHTHFPRMARPARTPIFPIWHGPFLPARVSGIFSNVTSRDPVHSPPRHECR